MKKLLLTLLTLVGLGAQAHAYDEPKYTVLQKFNASIELRRYQPYVVAEISRQGTREQAANAGFRPLFRFISEKNIPMTILVTQHLNDSQDWVVAFVMPPRKTLKDIPNPENQDIKLRDIAGYDAVVYRFSGLVSDKKIAANRKVLEAAAVQMGKQLIGAPTIAYYNSPFA